MGRLQGKVAIVTGSATGIGAAIAQRLAQEGAAVTINHLNTPDQAEDVRRQIDQAGGRACVVQGDVSKAGDVQQLIEQTVKQFGRLDIMVNNAGIEKRVPFLEVPESLWDSVIAVNLKGPWLCSQAAARQMVQQGDAGRIINISSVHEDMTMPTNAPYCASKGGLRMLMRTIAVELAPHKITVNNIGPGAIDTPMDASLKEHPEQMRALLGEIPIGRMGQPAEIGSLATFLASDEAAYITGSTYFIDGGMLRQSGSL